MPEIAEGSMMYVGAREAAKALGISLSTVYRRARKGHLFSSRESGRIMIGIKACSALKDSRPQTAEPTSTLPAPKSSGSGQRELMPRQGALVAFFQGMTWL